MLQELFELERRISVRLRPTYRGAIFVFGMALGWAGKLFVLSLLAMLMLLAGPGAGVVLFLSLFAVAVGAGSVAGTLHGVLQPLERCGQLGTWIRWSAAIFTYVVAIAVLAPHGPLSLDATFVPFAMVVAAVCAGCLVLLDDRKPTRPSQRRFRVQQARERLWAAASRLRSRMQRSAGATARTA